MLGFCDEILKLNFYSCNSQFYQVKLSVQRVQSTLGALQAPGDLESGDRKPVSDTPLFLSIAQESPHQSPPAGEVSQRLLLFTDLAMCSMGSMML